MSKKEEYKSIISEDSYDYEVPKQDGKKNDSLSKRAKLIIILAAFLSVMIPVYIFVLAPLLTGQSQEQTDPSVPECHYTETLYNKKYLCMMPALTEKEIEKVIIQNKAQENDGVYEYRSWELFYKPDTELWGVSDYEGTSFDPSYLATMMWYFTLMRTTDRIEYNSFDEIDLKVFGFDEESMPVNYQIITRDGKCYKVTMGKPTATGSGYYAYYTDEKGVARPTVYIISSGYGAFINSSVLDSVAATVTQLLDQKDYVPKYFRLKKSSGEEFLIKKLTDEEIEELETVKVSHLYITIDGKDYRYEASAYYSEMLYTVLQKGIVGTKVVYAKPDSIEAIPKEIFEKYGIDNENPYVDLNFEANAVYTTNSSVSVQQWVQFSEKKTNEQGVEYYYAYNASYDIIVEVPASSVSFIEEDSSKYCEKYIFMTPFYTVDKITIDSTALSDIYVNAGLERLKETFILSVESQKLNGVSLGSTGKPVPDVSIDVTGVSNFSKLYSVLLSMSTQFEIPQGVLDSIDLNKPDITLEVLTKSGKTHILRFYLYNSRHAYFTLDSEGRSYVKYDDLVKLLSSTAKVIKGEELKVGYTSSSSEHGITSDKIPPLDRVDTASIVFLVIILVFVVAGATAAILITLKKAKNNKPGVSGKK